MLKRLNSIILLLFGIFIIFVTPYSYGFENSMDKVSQAENVIQPDVRVNDLDIDPLNTQSVKKDVVPDAKKEGRKVIEYFLQVMFAVLLCAGILYTILVFIKKFRGSAFAVNDVDEYEELNLSSPTTKEEALKSFLNKSGY